MATLEIANLSVNVDGQPILKGVDLTIHSNEIHALLGPNGNGKSTLLQTIMGHPKYEITGGKIFFDGEDITGKAVNERSQAGLFLAMQYPVEISGITNADFMRAAVNRHSADPVNFFDFIRKMDKNLQRLGLKSDFAHRFINEGFSGGEKKRNEIVQMLMLKPKIAMLDEIDSGLDVDALKVVADAINEEQADEKMAMLIVSHYERFYQLVQPTYAHVMIDGRIVCSGDNELITRIDGEGYDWLIKERDIKLAKQPNKKLVYHLGICGIKEKAEL